MEFEDWPAAQRREWRAQIVGFVALVAVVGAATLGAFGHGVLSTRETASSSGELEVTSPRFARREARASLHISADASLASGRVFRVVVERRYADALGFEQVEPAPQAVETAGDHLVYVIERDGDTGLEMRIELVPDAPWSTSGVVRVGGQSVALDHFVFP